MFSQVDKSQTRIRVPSSSATEGKEEEEKK